MATKYMQQRKVGRCTAYQPKSPQFPNFALALRARVALVCALADMLRGLVGANLVREQGVSLSVAALADNGTLVPVTVHVTSPMSEADHVSHIYLLSSRNPVMQVAAFSLGPWSGRAEISTRVRLAGSQQLLALARLSDGQFRYAAAEVIVTESACVDAS